jgi:hypothetical protein
MLKPDHFGYNEATAASNSFQRFPGGLTGGEVHEKALREFDGFLRALQNAGISTLCFDDTEEPHTPDAIFPNNWVSTHEEGVLVLYPMEGENRRIERRKDIVDHLRTSYGYREVMDLTAYEREGKYLEGTGSLVLDRADRVVYACLSSRTDAGLVADWGRRMGYGRVVTFRAGVRTNEETGFGAFHPVYHTNVMLALGESAAVICAETIVNDQERGEVLSSLWGSGYRVVEITEDQLHRFAGNVLQLRTRDGRMVWAMSSQAFHAFSPHQKHELTSDGSRIVHSPLDTIELVGGGSARCMMAEIFPARGGGGAA